MSGERVATDLHPDLIMMWKRAQEGEQFPSNVSELEYNYLKTQPSSPLRGFVGFGCSFSGKWFGGYARAGSRNYASNASNSVAKKGKLLRGVQFLNKDYRELAPKGMLIYCDPPYNGTTEYEYRTGFNTDEFWQVMREWSQNNTVVVSEYVAPKDFMCLGQFPTKTDMHTKSGKELRTEKLFVYGQ